MLSSNLIVQVNEPHLNQCKQFAAHFQQLCYFFFISMWAHSVQDRSELNDTRLMCIWPEFCCRAIPNPSACKPRNACLDVWKDKSMHWKAGASAVEKRFLVKAALVTLLFWSVWCTCAVQGSRIVHGPTFKQLLLLQQRWDPANTDLPVPWICRVVTVFGASYSCHNSWWMFHPVKRSWIFSSDGSQAPSPPRRTSHSERPSAGSNGRTRAPAGSRRPRRSRRPAVWAARADRSNLWAKRAKRRWQKPVWEHCVWVWEWGSAWADPHIPARTTTCPPFASGAAPLPIAGPAKPKNPRGNTMLAATPANICCSPSFSSSGRRSGRRKHILCWIKDWWTGRAPTEKSANHRAGHFASSWKWGKKAPRLPAHRHRERRPSAVWSSECPGCRSCTRSAKIPADGPVWEGWRSSSHSRSWSLLSCLHFEPRRGALFCCAKPLLPPVQPWRDCGSSDPRKSPPLLLFTLC